MLSINFWNILWTVVNLLVLPNPDVLRLEEEYPVYLDGR